MTLSWSQVLVWILIGLLGGSLAGLLAKGEKRGFGIWNNLAIGLAGALVGGLLFRLFGLLPGLESVTVSLRDVVSAFVGSLLVLIALWVKNRNTPTG
jgi:uncharacterized membrane protein YeaQ/YmgE (transglycosylase-associated protein family)